MAYITATDLKNYMKINGNSDDTQLALFADRAQHVVDSYTHRVFEWAGAGTVKKFTPTSYLDGGDLYDMYTLSLGLNEFFELALFGQEILQNCWCGNQRRHCTEIWVNEKRTHDQEN